MTASYVDVRIERREFDRQARTLTQIEGLEHIDLAPPAAITGNPGEVELVFRVPPAVFAEEAIAGRVEAAGVKVLATRTRTDRWRRR